MQQGVIHIALQSSSFLNLLSTPSSAEDNSKTKNNEIAKITPTHYKTFEFGQMYAENMKKQSVYFFSCLS